MRPLGVFRPANILMASDYVDTILLTSSAQAFDWPPPTSTASSTAGCGFVSFASNANFAVRFGSTGAAWATSNTLGGNGSEINPTIRAIGSTSDSTGFSILGSSAGGVVSVAYYGRGGG